MRSAIAPLLLIALIAACGARGPAAASPTESATSSPPPAARESAAPTAPQPTGPMTSPRPVQHLERIEAFALGELHGRWAFALSIGQLPGTSPQLGELWAIPLDGGAPKLAARFPTALGAGSGPDSNVLDRQLSPDGRRIILSAATAEGGLGMRYRLFVVELETGGFRMVGRDDGDHDIRPAWSPDGTRIAYVRSLVDTAGQDGFDDGLWVMGADGSGARRVVASRQGTGTANFGWSPDGRWIAYAHSFEDATFQLLELKTGRTVSYGYVQTERPYDWRPDGALAMVTYSTPRMGQPVIGIADAPGEPLRTVAEWGAETYVDNVRWRPGADEIAYSAKTVTRGAIVVRGIAGGAVERIFDRIARSLSWASDGREIVYLHAGQSSDRPAVHVFAVDGGPDRVIEVPASWLLGDLTTRGYP